MKINVLFIGGINPNEIGRTYYSEKQMASQAANSRWMWNVINGLEDGETSITILNAPNIPSYQEDHSCIFHKGYNWKHNSDAKDYSITFLNIFPFSIISRKIAITRYCKKWIRNTEGKKVILGITPHYPIVSTLSKFSHLVKTCLIVPDLPEYTGASRRGSVLYRIFKKIDVFLFYHNTKKIDNYIILTDEMKTALGKDKRYLRIECMVDPKLAYYQTEGVNEPEDDFTIVYTGTVHSHYGIFEVASAIHESNLKCTFYICGDGTGAKELQENFVDDKRIQYLGIVSIEKALEMQRNADILINPRPNDGSDYLKYSFPSKTLEYMAAAKPVVCHKLPSIPKEYDNYLIYLRNNSPNEVISTLCHLKSMGKEERNRIGIRNREFVVNNKSNNAQAKKIASFLREDI